MRQYLDAIRKIRDTGVDDTDRTGVGTRSLFGHQMRFDLREGFPAVTTKRLAWKAVTSELLWFLEGSDDERRLAEILHGKPREELIGKTTIWTANADTQGKALGYENTDLVKKLGPVYGVQWRGWSNVDWIDAPGHELGQYKKIQQTKVDQISQLVHDLKTNPQSRRHILTAWNVGELNEMALPPCHCFAQFYVRANTLSCQLYQRSNDFFLGVPFNIASYALLTHMLAQVCGLNVGDLIHTSGDAHLYLNHMDQVEEQLSREPKALPKLWMNPLVKNIDDFTMEDFKLIDYDPAASIKAPMAV